MTSFGKYIKGQVGFTLIEGMVAAGILSIGLLALAGMQVMSLGRNVDSNELGRVTNMAAEMIERMQFNRRNALAYNLIDTANVATQPPTAQPMARGDYAQWQTLLNNSGLSNVRGLITATRVDPDPTVNPVSLNRISVNVTINWTGAVRSDVSVTRNKAVTFVSVMAPE